MTAKRYDVLGRLASLAEKRIAETTRWGFEALRSETQHDVCKDTDGTASQSSSLGDQSSGAVEDEHQEHPTAQRNKSRDPEGAYGRNGSSPHKPGPLRKLCDELGVAGIEDEDAVLAEAQALAETERQELREHAKLQAEEWQKQRIQKDECSAPDQQSVN